MKRAGFFFDSFAAEDISPDIPWLSGKEVE